MKYLLALILSAAVVLGQTAPEKTVNAYQLLSQVTNGPSVLVNNVIALEYLYSVADGLGGMFAVDPNSAVTPDGTNAIAMAQGGRLLRLWPAALGGGGTDTWQVVGGTNLQPVDLTLQPAAQTPWISGTNTLRVIDRPPTSGYSLMSIGDTTHGETQKGIYIAMTGGNTDTNYSEVNMRVLTNNASLTIDYSDGNNASGIELDSSLAGINDARLRMFFGSQTTVLLEPSVADGVSPFTLDTVLAHTSGNLLGVANDTTNVFGVVYNGAITTGGRTNRWTFAAATNTAITASITNACIATVDGRKVYLLIANEVPP